MRTKILSIVASFLFLCGCQHQIESDPSPTKKSTADIIQGIGHIRIAETARKLTDFGGSGDSATDNKPAFDKVMQYCLENGGGRIIVPPGVYLVNGPIHLVDNSCLDLQKGAKICFGTDADDYLPVVATSWEGTLLYNYSPLIYAYQAKNVAITGEGTIDGNGRNGFSGWYDRQKPAQERSRQMNRKDVPMEQRIFGNGHFLRPQLIQFYGCKNILVEGVTIENSPFWCVHFLQSENIIARKVKFHAYNKNNDGFDAEYSKNILIEDIDFDNADDNVAIKAGRDHEGRKLGITSENIVIRNCRFKGLHGIVIGSEMSAGVEHVYVENCEASSYCKRGIYLKSNPDRGGFIRNIYVDNVRFQQVEDALFITSFYHGEGEGHATDIRDIFVRNFYCKSASNAGLVIQGFPSKKVTNVQFSDIKIDSCKAALSFSHTANIVFNDVTIGEQIAVPSAVR
ncbi:glycoside hydrolase family 28 protein [Sphingobacterium griseoflavum]|uniref:Glycoside hydrolase n=1 Tax=Sphingobacterium griseoflavum TaxID=1474952 RepID=A0ABQ3HVU1_9SPHI|nr:glycoside hydrolase family 28 protein [Sphingobacterium griseoflavum]GHE39612.1 glycoside hydrolase [Sphingobacterium griseoflavum]